MVVDAPGCEPPPPPPPAPKEKKISVLGGTRYRRGWLWHQAGRMHWLWGASSSHQSSRNGSIYIPSVGQKYVQGLSHSSSGLEPQLSPRLSRLPSRKATEKQNGSHTRVEKCDTGCPTSRAGVLCRDRRVSGKQSSVNTTERWHLDLLPHLRRVLPPPPSATSSRGS